MIAPAHSDRETGSATHLCALGVLQSLLKYRYDGIRLKIDDEIWASSKDTECGLAREDVRAICHGEDLGLESGPWMAALHGIIGEVCDGVDGLAADDGSGLVEEGVEEDALEGLDGLGAEVVVERDALCVCGAEEEAAEEDEGEGAHLRARA